MKTINESFDDIIFENRNKEYGAYELRNKYSKRGLTALSIAMFILFTAVGWPLIASMMNVSTYFGNGNRTTDGVTLVDLNKDKPEVTPPKLPEPPADPKVTKFKLPDIVDTITHDEVELPATVEFGEGINAPIGDTTSVAPEIFVPDKDPVVERVVEVFELNEKPIFPDGDAGIIKYVSQNTKYPASALETGTEGTVYIRFVVTKNGDIGEAKVLRAVDPLLENEALRVVKGMPKWIPGKINGRPVNVWFIIPVKFVIQK